MKWEKFVKKHQKLTMEQYEALPKERKDEIIKKYNEAVEKHKEQQARALANKQEKERRKIEQKEARKKKLEEERKLQQKVMELRSVPPDNEAKNIGHLFSNDDVAIFFDPPLKRSFVLSLTPEEKIKLEIKRELRRKPISPNQKKKQKGTDLSFYKQTANFVARYFDYNWENNTYISKDGNIWKKDLNELHDLVASCACTNN